MEPLNRYLDAAVLRPEMSRGEAEAAIRHCLDLRTRTVCVRPCDLALAKALCAGSQTGACVVLGFPHGVQLAASKADEARRYLALGADEVDMVANYGLLRSGLWDEARADMAAVAAVTRPAGVLLKVILETCCLAPDEIARATELAIEAGADFVKTSTGFAEGGASDEAVRTMLAAAAGRIRVKASGGIRDRARAEHFVAMGVARLGVGYAACAAICQEVPASPPPVGSY